MGLTASVTLFVAAVGASGGLRVETGTPAALCPDIAEVRRVVRDRLTVEGEGEWVASYDLVHRPERESGDVVRLALRDPAGRLRLQRDLPRSGASCVALAQAVAMVLETYFRHPGEPIDEAEAPRATVKKTGPPAAAAPSPTPAAPPPPAGRGLAGAVFGGWTAGPSSPAVMFDLSYSGFRRWAVGIDGVLMTSEQAQSIDLQPEQATGFLRSTLFHAWGAVRLGPGHPVELLAGPELALGLDRMRTMNVPEGRANVRAAVGVGARVQLRIWLASRVALSFISAADYTPRAWAGRFEIEGVTTEPFPAAEARLLLGVGVGFLAFP